MADPKVLVLWTHVRTRSTMLERCFIARDDIETYHEPMADAAYWGKERSQIRFSLEECAKNWAHLKDVTYLSRWRETITVPEGKAGSFAKDMSQFLFLLPIHPETYPRLHQEPGNPTLLPESELLAPNVVHAFLTRNPKQSVPSWYKMLNGGSSQARPFWPDEVALRPTRLLYEFIASKSAEPPLVLDSDDLVADPEGCLRALCGAVGWDYKSEMLDWRASLDRAKVLLSKFPGAHDTAEATSTVLELPPEDATGMPQEYHEAIKDYMVDYLYLKERAYKPSGVVS